MRVATGTGQDAASVWRVLPPSRTRISAPAHQRLRSHLACGGVEQRTYSHEFVARALQSLGGPHSDQTGRRGGGALASVKVLALTVGAAALALVMAAGWGHPSVQLQLARPTARSKTQRNSAPQLPHGLPARRGWKGSPGGLLQRSPGTPSRDAKQLCRRVGSGRAPNSSRDAGGARNSTPVAPLTAATW